MTTPICDFVRRYAQGSPLRLHMPGHKGCGPLGMEALDITEISGADSLYEAHGIIAESEGNASRIFGCPTFYSTEGSSLCIRAMLHLVAQHARAKGCERPVIAAARNVHKTFISAAALLDLDVQWLYSEEETGYLSCRITPHGLDRFLSARSPLPAAVYLTSPDYLGNLSELSRLAHVCHQHGVLLLVDNAHGAYLKFLPNNFHPIDQGVDLCCDSAHKTLPVLTGGAYLHIGNNAPSGFVELAKSAMALFGSTSPSYLILQSLDAANELLSDPSYSRSIVMLASMIENCRKRLISHGFSVLEDCEPLKLTILPRTYGYTGTELAEHLRKHGMECEFSDPDLLVLMLTPAIREVDLERVLQVLTALPRRTALFHKMPSIQRPQMAMSIREAVFSPCEILPAEQCVGRVLAAASVSCPPAVPILVCGEKIDDTAIDTFRYYGIEYLTVVANT